MELKSRCQSDVWNWKRSFEGAAEAEQSRQDLLRIHPSKCHKNERSLKSFRMLENSRRILKRSQKFLAFIKESFQYPKVSPRIILQVKESLKMSRKPQKRISKNQRNLKESFKMVEKSRRILKRSQKSLVFVKESFQDP